MAQENDQNNLNPEDAGLLQSVETGFPEIEVEISEEDFKSFEDEVEEQVNTDTDAQAPTSTTQYSDNADDMAIATYETWLEKGLIPETDDFDGTFESLEKITESIPNIVQDALINRAPEQGRSIVNYILNKGEDLKLEELNQFIEVAKEAQSTKSIESFTESEEALIYLEKKFKENAAIDDDMVSAMLDKLEEKGDSAVLEKANSFLEKEKEEASKTVEERERQAAAERQARLDQQKQFNQQFVDTLKELNWAKDKVQNIQTEYNEGVTQKKFDAVLQDPKSLVHLINFFTYYDMEDKTFDFTSFAKSAASKDIKEVKKSMLRDRFKSVPASSKSRNTPMQTEFNPDDLVLDN